MLCMLKTMTSFVSNVGQYSYQCVLCSTLGPDFISYILWVFRFVVNTYQKYTAFILNDHDNNIMNTGLYNVFNFYCFH